MPRHASRRSNLHNPHGKHVYGAGESRGRRSRPVEAVPVVAAADVPFFPPNSLDASDAVAHFQRILLPPSSRRAFRRPIVDVEDSGAWPVTALLWFCMWSTNWTFLHIPKTGGTAIELVDPTAPQLRLASLFAVRRRDGSPAMSLQAGGRCTWWPRVHDSTARTPNVVHLTPSLWSACFGEQWRPYESGGTYCVVRDPVERFVSEFIFAKLHWYWPRHQCPQKSAWDKRKDRLMLELWCFARLTERMLERFTWQRAAKDSQLNLTELLTHVLPQHDFVADDERKQTTCDLVFSFDDVKAANLLPAVNQVNHLRERGGATRIFLKRYVYGNTTLLQLLGRMYPRDFELWERVRLHHQPTALHRWSVREQADELFRSHPRLPKREPSCLPNSCDCPACCLASYNMTEAPRFGCLQCVLTHPECGGWGRWQAWSLPRAMGALCGGVGGSACNTCNACCEAPWVETSGASCEDCERTECVQSAAPHPARLHPQPHELISQARKDYHAFRLEGISTELSRTWVPG